MQIFGKNIGGGSAASDFTAFDLAGSLALNTAVTHLAANDSSFRVGVMKDANGEVPVWADARLIGGVIGAVVAQFAGQNPMVRRMGHDTAIGLLGSFVSTETCRSAAESKMKAESTPSADSEAPMLGMDDFGDDDLFDDDALGLEDELDSEMNFAYGW